MTVREVIEKLLELAERHGLEMPVEARTCDGDIRPVSAMFIFGNSMEQKTIVIDAYVREVERKMTTTKQRYTDEAYYLKEKPLQGMSGGRMIRTPSGEPEVIPHNTMRFDVHLAHVHALLSDGTQTKERIVEAIRNAIINAVDYTLGTGLDGVPLPCDGDHIVYPKTVMLHRECVSFDLS